MAYRINYSKVISQANSIAGDASELSAQIRVLNNWSKIAELFGKDKLQMRLLLNFALCVPK